MMSLSEQWRFPEIVNGNRFGARPTHRRPRFGALRLITPPSYHAYIPRDSIAKMLAGPSRFDPFNGLSFVELNKRRRGEYDRRPGERIYDHTYKPKVERIWIRRNGDLYNR